MMYHPHLQQQQQQQQQQLHHKDKSFTMQQQAPGAGSNSFSYINYNLPMVNTHLTGYKPTSSGANGQQQQWLLPPIVTLEEWMSMQTSSSEGSTPTSCFSVSSGSSGEWGSPTPTPTSSQSLSSSSSCSPLMTSSVRVFAKYAPTPPQQQQQQQYQFMLPPLTTITTSTTSTTIGTNQFEKQVPKEGEAEEAEHETLFLRPLNNLATDTTVACTTATANTNTVAKGTSNNGSAATDYQWYTYELANAAPDKKLQRTLQAKRISTQTCPMTQTAPARTHSECISNGSQQYVQQTGAMSAQYPQPEKTNENQIMDITQRQQQQTPYHHSYHTLTHHNDMSSAASAAAAASPSSASSSSTCSNHSLLQHNNGHWTQDEHELFLQGLHECGNNWKAIARYFVKSRTRTQVASHAQTFFKKKL